MYRASNISLLAGLSTKIEFMFPLLVHKSLYTKGHSTQRIPCPEHGNDSVSIALISMYKPIYLIRVCVSFMIVHTNIDQTLVNSLYGRLNCEIGGLDCHVVTTEYRTHVYCIRM